MAKKKAAAKKKTNALDLKTSEVGGAAAILFAGAAVILMGSMQEGNLALVMVGFGSALAFVAAVLIGIAINSK